MAPIALDPENSPQLRAAPVKESSMYVFFKACIAPGIVLIGPQPPT